MSAVLADIDLNESSMDVDDEDEDEVITLNVTVRNHGHGWQHATISLLCSGQQRPPHVMQLEPSLLLWLCVLQVLPILVRGMPLPFLVTTRPVPARQPLLR
jgi:hypothetical protein